MGSEQELVVEQQQVVPARKLKTRPFSFLSRSLHRIGELVNDQIIAGIISDANKNTGYPGYYDRREFNESVESIGAEMKFLRTQHEAVDDKGEPKAPLPDGQLNSRIHLLVPSAEEKAKFRGQIWKGVHLPLFNLLDVLESHDDIENASEIEDWETLESAFQGVKDARDFYLDKKKYKQPRRQKLKGTNPPPEFKMEEFFEPGAETPKVGVKDVKVVEVSVSAK